MKKAQKSQQIYLSRNSDGFVCSYNSNTHRCVGVILAMGDNVELYEKNHEKYIGELDPKYNKK